mmetsp:Transcript_92261/g.192950  ORF Transcript_92261/g.192950 Transcript_92261/m.192950 type:complete len:320 (-) Transcript_92261:1581-2540(-)
MVLCTSFNFSQLPQVIVLLLQGVLCLCLHRSSCCNLLRNLSEGCFGGSRLLLDIFLRLLLLSNFLSERRQLGLHLRNLFVLLSASLRVLLLLVSEQHREVAQANDILHPAGVCSIFLCPCFDSSFLLGCGPHKQLPRLPLRGICPIEEATNLLRGEVLLLALRIEGILHQGQLEDLQTEHFVLDQSTHDESIDLDRPGLPNAEHSVHCLRVCRRIPGWVEDDCPIRSCEVQSEATDACCQQHHLQPWPLRLKFADSLGAVVDLRLPIDAQILQLQWLHDTNLDEVQHACSLRKNQDVVTLRNQGWQHCSNALQLGTLLK